MRPSITIPAARENIDTNMSSYPIFRQRLQGSLIYSSESKICNFDHSWFLSVAHNLAKKIQVYTAALSIGSNSCMPQASNLNQTNL